MEFSNEEIEQFSRQLILNGFSLRTQSRLKSTHLKLSSYDFLSLRLFQGLGVGQISLETAAFEENKLLKQLSEFAPAQDYRLGIQLGTAKDADLSESAGPLTVEQNSEVSPDETNFLLSEFRKIPPTSVKTLASCLEITRELLASE